MSLSGAMLKILLLEDDHDIAEFLEVILAGAGAVFELTHVLRLADALRILASAAFDVVLLDLWLEDSQGIDTLVKLYRRAPTTPIVVLTGQNDEQLGTRLLQEGAQDYLIKGQVDGPALLRSMHYAIERKRSEEALRESEMRYRALVEHMPAITYIAPLDDASTTLYVSAQIEAVLGFSQDEWMADRQLWSKQIHPDDRAQVLADIELAIAQGAPASVEYRMLARDGRIRWFHDTGTIIRDHTEQPLFFQGVVLDITEHKQAEELLRESEERFRGAFDYAAIGMALVGLDGRWLQVNRSLCELVGYTEQELLATTFQAVTHPDDLDADLTYVQQLLAGEIHTYQMEKRYLHKLGYEVWVLLSASLVRDAQGNPLYFISQMINITESKLAEQALRQSEARYRTLVEKLPLGIYEIDRDGRLLSINQAGLHIIGAQDIAQIHGRAYLDIIPSAEPAQLAILMARAYAGEVLEIEYSGSVDGVSRIFTTTLIPQRDADGAVYKLVGTTRDITEQRETRLEAEQDRDRLDAMLESSNDAILMVDLDGRIALVNRAFSIFFGVEPDRVIGMSSEQLLNERWDHFEQARHFQAAIKALLHEPQHEVAGEVTLLRPTKRMLVWYSGPVRTRAATVLGRLFIFRDATREREADLMKAEFISIVSHELRTPLTSIKGFTDLIIEGDAGEISAEVREFLEIVKVSADQLVEITDDILEASRIEAGKIKLSPQPVEIDEVVHAVALSIQMMTHAKGQTLTVDLPPDLPELYADRERLAQIFTNLLSNAHKYTPAGGQIEIGARLVRNPATARLTQGDAAGPWVVVSVADTGIGIAPADQQHLFDRFYRVSSPETQGIGGTGLGLHITRSLVELQDGAIWFESTPGQGSTFFFSLPVVSHAPVRVVFEPPTIDGQRQLILLVEPKATLARLLQGHLELVGYSVTIVDEGRVALALASVECPALIVLATRLPDMDGFTLIERLHADERTADIPLVVIATREEAERALRLGVAGYLSEPIDERSLRDIVHAALVEDRRSIALVVDDDPQIVQALTALLAKRGYNAFAATDGQQGLTLATRLQPSLVLLDLWMPGLNGFQVLNVLRQHPATRSIPVIAMNESDIASSALRRVLTLGAVDLITKPPDLQMLQGLIAVRLDLMELAGGVTSVDSGRPG
jgi:PAS domain S-box-containing protein